MTSAREFYGDAKGISLAASQIYYIHRDAARVWHIVTTGANAVVRTQDARHLFPGGPVFYVCNFGPNTIALRKNGGSLITLVASGKCAKLILTDNSTADGTWSFILRDINQVQEPLLSPILYFLCPDKSGSNSGTAIFEYDPQVDTLTTKSATTTHNHQNGAAAQIAAAGYVTGSFFSGSGRDELEEYDPDTITARATMPAEKQHPQAATVQGKGYWISGEDSLLDVHEYDPPPTNSWSAMTDIPDDSRLGVAEVIQDIVYNAGGIEGGGTSGETTLYDYDPATGIGGTWSTLTSIPSEGSRDSSGAVFSDELFLFMGRFFQSVPTGPQDRVIKYDPATGVGGTWTTLTPYVEDRWNHGFARIDDTSSAELGYLLGGLTYTTSSVFVTAITEYDPATDTWTTMTATTSEDLSEGRETAIPITR